MKILVMQDIRKTIETEAINLFNFIFYDSIRYAMLV